MPLNIINLRSTRLVSKTSFRDFEMSSIGDIPIEESSSSDGLSALLPFVSARVMGVVMEVMEATLA